MFGIRDREAGNVIDSGYPIREMAETVMADYESMDMADGIYEENFYEVFEYNNIFRRNKNGY